MSLDVEVKGLPRHNYGYGQFNQFRGEIVKAVYGLDLYEIWKKKFADDDDVKRWNEKCNDDLDLFILHSDCDGKLTVSECRKVRNAMKSVEEKINKSDMSKEHKQMVNEWYCMFAFCARNRVIMKFN